jgi:4-amino-4-deoxy-L-arabinose transferase-like glycosyltransferase
MSERSAEPRVRFSPRTRPWAPLLVAAITVLGLLLRLPSFGDSLFGDELSAYYVVNVHSLGTVIHLLSGHSTELNPPLFFMLAWVSEKIGGDSAQALKLVSLLAGTATIPLTYVLGRRTLGGRAGTVASALVALCPFLIFYSTEARPYALLVMLLLLSTLALLNAVQTGRPAWWAAYAALSCAAAYTHFTAVFLLAGQFAWAFVTQRHARRRLLAANAAAVVGFLPWLPNLVKTARSPGTRLYGLLEPFNLHAVRIDLGRWSIGHPLLPLSAVPGSLGAGLVLAGVAVAAILASLITVRTKRGAVSVRPPPEGALVVILACAAPLGVALYSSFRESVWFARNLISSWPGFAVSLAALLTFPRGAWRGATLGLVLVGFGIGAVTMLMSSHQRPDYASAAALIDHTDGAGGPAVELVAPTPGPPTALEAALAFAGSAQRHPVLRIGYPPLRAVLSAPPYAPLQSQPGELVARAAAALAGRGTLFIVAPVSAPITMFEAIRHLHRRDGAGALGEFASFLGALPQRFHPLRSRTYPGLIPVTVSVYRG